MTKKEEKTLDSSLERETGYYYVKINDKWDIGNWSDGKWQVCGYQEFLNETTDITEIGEKVTMPTHKHEWNDSFQGKLSICKCGVILVRNNAFTEAQIKEFRRLNKIPCKVVAEGEL